MSDLMKEIGGRIKHYRKAKGMTQKELGEKVGCHEVTIRQYENGLREPRMVSKLAIARALDVSYDRLFSLKDESATDRNVGTKLGTNLAEVGTDVPDINVGELISREQAIETFKDCAANGVGIDGIVDALKQLPPANCSEFPNNSDTISRQAAIDALDCINGVEEVLRSIPPAEPKRGKWIKTARWGRVYYCNQCRNYLDFDGVNAGRGSTNFCPNCGADMRGEQNAER